MAKWTISPPSYGDPRYWIPGDSTWSMSVQNCMPNCTVFTHGKCLEMGIDCPTGFGADYDFRHVGWSMITSIDDVCPGDVCEYDDYSIGVCVSGSGRNAICHHSWYTTESGHAHNPHPHGKMWRDPDIVGSTPADVWNYMYNRWPERCCFAHNVDSDGGGSFVRAFRSGGHVDPQPDPPPGANWRWEDTTWEQSTITLVPHYVEYSDFYECGSGVFGDQSGTQDDPQAPTLIHPKGDRLNERWEPFNMYTDERILTYTSDGKPIWSNWETKYTGSDNFPLGSQPTYGNGWEMEWQGDDD